MFNESNANPNVRKPTVESVISGFLDVEILKTKTTKHPAEIKMAAFVQKQNTTNKKMFKGKCWICKSPGHPIFRCPEKDKRQSNPNHQGTKPDYNQGAIASSNTAKP